jgi:sporulation protein YlmC with PRC-barrel domain
MLVDVTLYQLELGRCAIHQVTRTRLESEETRRAAMAETPYTIGSDVSCTDGACGQVARIIVDPVARTITHLVVEPKHEHKHGRLVPLSLVETVPGGIRLRCTRAEFENLDPAEETQFRPASGWPGSEGYGSEQVLSWRYYGLTTGTGTGDGTGLDSSAGPGRGHSMRAATYDSVPLGEIEVCHGDHVWATDGEIGHVEGLVIDPRNHGVTHVLLQEGHLWGRKEVSIPIGVVTTVDDGISVNLSKRQIGDLPPVDIDHPAADPM